LGLAVDREAPGQHHFRAGSHAAAIQVMLDKAKAIARLKKFLINYR